MQSFFRRLAACAARFCANPQAVIRGRSNPHTPAAPTFAGGGPLPAGAPSLYYRS